MISHHSTHRLKPTLLVQPVAKTGISHFIYFHVFDVLHFIYAIAIMP